MRIFIAINNLQCGGAQKSLISFLNSISEEIAQNIKIDLCILDQEDIFFDQIPSFVNVINNKPEIKYIFKPIKEIDFSNIEIGLKIKIALAKIRMKLINKGKLCEVQHVWDAWNPLISKHNEEYDVAISYVDGFSNYYIIDKINAKRKIIWVHNEYSQLSYWKEYDRAYFAKADSIVTISDVCVNSLVNEFPDFRQKIYMIPNLSSEVLINRMAKEGSAPEFEKGKINLLSIGRLNSQKGFDMAIEAANILKNENIDFCWYIIGEGELERELKAQIDKYALQDKFILLGTRKNPYPYIKQCELFIQSSRYEGKSIALDEAKILKKPIIVTNYPSAKDSIIDNVNGRIVEFSAEKLAEGIKDMLSNKSMCDKYLNNLEKELEEKASEIELYYELLF